MLRKPMEKQSEEGWASYAEISNIDEKEERPYCNSKGGGGFRQIWGD